MQKARRLMGARGFEQREGAAQVGFENGRRRKNTAIDVRLRGEMDEDVRSSFRHHFIYQCGVANVAVHETVTPIACYRREVFEVARVSELVEVHHLQGPLSFRL